MMVRILVLLLLHCVSALKMPLRPATAQVISRRGFLMATAPLFALGTQAQEARASYAMNAAAERSQSWEATGAAAEKQALQSIENELEQKRRFRETDSTNYLGGEYTSYRRGSAREAWEAEQKAKQGASGPSSYFKPEDIIAMGAARRAATP